MDFGAAAWRLALRRAGGAGGAGGGDGEDESSLSESPESDTSPGMSSGGDDGAITGATTSAQNVRTVVPY